MSKLLSEFSYTGKTVHHVRLERPDVLYTDVLAKYRENNDKVLLIFCGHGEEDALLTAEKQDCSNLKELSDEDVFYDSDYFNSGPDTMAAFCSNAGKHLGPDFARKSGRNFLGFCDELCFIHSHNDDCNSWWTKLLVGPIVKIVDDEKIDEKTVDFVRSLFEDAYQYFCSEKGSLANEALGMRMCLRRNLSALCNY